MPLLEELHGSTLRWNYISYSKKKICFSKDKIYNTEKNTLKSKFHTALIQIRGKISNNVISFKFLYALTHG